MVTTPATPDPTAIAGAFAELSRDLLGAPDEPAIFDLVVSRAVEIIPGCDAAGITVRRRRGRFETVAVSDALVRRFDDWQVDMVEGPSVDQVFEVEDRVVHDLRHEPRWPAWAGAVSEQGIRSLISMRLLKGTEVLGALTLYSYEVGTFDDGPSRELAEVFALHSAEALGQVKLVSGLQAALETRHMIGIAQGVLSQRYDITYERAFDVMRRYSNDSNTKLRDIAASVLEKRSLGDFDALVAAH